MHFGRLIAGQVASETGRRKSVRFELIVKKKTQSFVLPYFKALEYVEALAAGTRRAVFNVL